eukprot:TRINITY_DN843_c0_g2_i3.p1 TRINITY_DN843_c0_g2~~TRINITY_DN843_c0_g2_i3.p1  ORF type:complete len:205 (+),score=41.12 TRINITY_DN843_c0_g2_i3:136-750(+)
MSFFGLTMLGPSATTVMGEAALQILSLHSFGDEVLAEAFRQVDAEDRGVIHKEQICLFLAMLYEGQSIPAQEEMMFKTYFETVKGDEITYADMMKAVQLIRARIPQPSAARKFTSYEELTSFKKKHQRIDTDPNQMFREPVTSSHEYGWYDVATSSKLPPNTNSSGTKWDAKTSRNRVAPQDYYGCRVSDESRHAEAVYREDYK